MTNDENSNKNDACNFPKHTYLYIVMFKSSGKDRYFRQNKHGTRDIVSTTKLVPSSYLKVHTHVLRILK